MKELSIRAAELFTPKPWKHDFNEHRQRYCCKCKQYNCNAKQSCTVPDPIDINDWNVAMKLFREVLNGKAMHALTQMFRDNYNADKPESKSVTFWWALRHATPADYIEAACIAKDAENG